jgi:hypothetical protein
MHNQMSPSLGGVEPFDDFGVFVAVAADDGGGVFFGDGGDFEAASEVVVSRLFGWAVAVR